MPGIEGFSVKRGLRASTPQKLAFDQESMTTYGNGVAAINLSPCDVGSRLDVTPDKGADQLGDFEILVLKLAGHRFGFLRHEGSPTKFSQVCDFDQVGADATQAALQALPALAGVEFNPYDEAW